MKRLIFCSLFIFCANAFAAYDCKNINRLDQLGSTDVTIWCVDDAGELPEIRVNKNLPTKDATTERLEREAQTEIARALEPPSPPTEPEPTVDELKAEIETLKEERDTLQAEKAALEVQLETMGIPISEVTPE